MVSVEQILACGLTRQAAAARVRAGTLHRYHHGVYGLVPYALLPPRGRLMAAVLAAGPGAALSHTDAAKLHGLIGWSGRRFDVTVPSRNGRRRPGLAIHRSANLRPTDVTQVDGIPCTTVARTIFDLGDSFTRRRLERVLDEADALGLFDLHALLEQIDHNPGRTRAVRALRRGLAHHQVGTTLTDGQIGERMLRIIRQAGLPDPRVQFAIDLGDGEPMIQADFAYPEIKLIVETDGGVHRRGRRVERDARRDQRAARAGWQTLRVAWDHIVQEPARIAATVLSVVSERSSRLGVTIR